MQAKIAILTTLGILLGCQSAKAADVPNRSRVIICETLDRSGRPLTREHTERCRTLRASTVEVQNDLELRLRIAANPEGPLDTEYEQSELVIHFNSREQANRWRQQFESGEVQTLRLPLNPTRRYKGFYNNAIYAANATNITATVQAIPAARAIVERAPLANIRVTP